MTSCVRVDDDQTSLSCATDDQTAVCQLVPTSTRAAMLATHIERQIFHGTDQREVDFCQMTPYSDAQWLFNVYRRKVLHDGKAWFRWNSEASRWVKANQWMHCLVAESCVLPYRRIRSGFSDYRQHHRSLLHEGYRLDSLLDRIENKLLGSTDVLTLGDALKDTECRIVILRKHISRLHSLGYQRKVLAIASTVFFGVERKKKQRWWGPAANLLPLSDGVIERNDEGETVRRRVLPSDRIKSSTPVLPDQSLTLDASWFDCFHKADLLVFQHLLAESLFVGVDCSILLWGVCPKSAERIVSFFELLLGDYCSPESKYARIAIKVAGSLDLVLPCRSERLLNIVIFPSSKSSIDAPPAKSILAANSIVALVDKHVTIVDKMQRFWGHRVTEESSTAVVTTTMRRRQMSRQEALNWLTNT